MPDTRRSSGADAVLTSTPTAFTQSSTTASSERDRAVPAMSCWYWPTPIDLGSILTSSASGSCRRRAIDTAPRSDTSSSGSSAEACSEAEYTDAPASDTTAAVSPRSGSRAMRSRTSAWVSREAVPLPMATSSTPCSRASSPRRVREVSHCRRGTCGWTVSVATTLPVPSITATFTPVRRPGSRPMVGRAPAGAASNRSRRLPANTSTAPSSATSRRRTRRSTIRRDRMRVRQAQRTASPSQRSAGRPRSATPTALAMRAR